ncbi:MAG: type I secretion system permease/ATPase [Hyphomicrobium sp.]
MKKDAIRDGLRAVRGGFLAVAALSFVVNLLMLTGPIFMLQVYDRVLTSRSVPTLVVLLGLAVALYAMMGLFDFLRTRILSRLAHWIDNELSAPAFRSWMTRAVAGGASGYKPLQDIAVLRGFLSSPTMLALFDLPWFPIYLGVVFLLHVQLGLLATAGAVVVIALTLANEWLTARSTAAATKAEIAESRFTEHTQRSADTVLAMGMIGNTTGAWSGLKNATLAAQQRATETSEVFTATSKAFRLLLQSAILALGAWLAIRQQITPGAIVAASIIAGRALAPIDQTLGGWRMIKRARLARQRLGDYLKRDATPAQKGVKLPRPQPVLDVAGVVKRSPRKDPTREMQTILAGISFELRAGDGLGVIGPSASGKSSLARLLVGLWMPDQGTVRLDGATFEQWEPDDIGPHIGYLPQEVVLMSGSIAENIGRFDPSARNEDIVDAARRAGVHEIILGFAEGYATRVDDPTSPLTGGQRQRIALARALYGKPVLIVLDEPNSNLDAEGDIALSRAIQQARSEGAIVVVMAHRPSAISAVDKVLMLREGRMIEFGPKDEVLKKVTRVA